MTWQDFRIRCGDYKAGVYPLCTGWHVDRYETHNCTARTPAL